MKPAVIFDLDGTLANTKHREHYIAKKPKNFMKFHEMCIHDPVNKDVLSILMAFVGGSYILLATGQPDDFRELREAWLFTHAIPYSKLYMRKSGDNRGDDIVKYEILQEMRKDGYKPWVAFEDRDRVVKMWRENGIRCCQVDYGNF